VPQLDCVYLNRDKGDHITLSTMTMREPCNSGEDYGGLISGKVYIDFHPAPLIPLASIITILLVVNLDIGTLLGPYEVLSPLGAGAMGEVYLAEDTKLRREVTDRDATRVDFSPVDSTVGTLATIPLHEIRYPEDSRIEPEELNVYRLQARLIEVRRENDKDLHLILSDLERPEVRIIAEIPAPECANGSGHEDEFRQARGAVSSIN